MMVTKTEVLRLIDQLSEDDLRILYTFIEEYQAAEREEDDLFISQIYPIID